MILLFGMAAAAWWPGLQAQPTHIPGSISLAAMGGINPSLASPTLLPAGNITTTSFTANWSPVANADGYSFEISAAADFSQTLWSGVVGNVTNFNVSASYLQPGTKYYFRVTAGDGVSSSAASAVGTVTLGPFPAPLVTGTSNITVNSFVANWIPVPEATSYVLDVSTTPDFLNLAIEGFNVGNGAASSANVSAPYWDQGALQPNITYYYRIAAKGPYNTSSPPSVTQNLTTVVLVAPSVAGAGNVTINSFTTSWSPVTGATAYYIDVSTTLDFGNLVVTNKYLGDDTVTSANVALEYNVWHGQGNLPSGGTYYYRLRAANGGAVSPNSDIHVFTTPVYAAPVLGAATNITNGGFTASWTAAPGAISYDFEISTTPDFWLNANGTTFGYGVDGSRTSFTTTPTIYWDAALIQPGGTYYYRVTATDGIINSPSSTVQSVTAAAFPPPVLGNATNVTITGFTANWNTVTAATGYDIFVSDTANFADLLVSTHVDGGNTTSAALTTVPWSQYFFNPGTMYYYRVRADDGTVVSANSTTQTVTTHAFPAPLVGNATNVTVNTFTANWVAVPEATGYGLDISSTADFGNVTTRAYNLGDGNTTSSTVNIPWWLSNVLQPNTTYYYRIYASGPNATSPYSTTQTVTTQAFPAPTVSPATNITSTSFTAQWGLVPGATGYAIDIATRPDFQFGSIYGGYLGDGNTTNATWTSLHPGLTYYYRIYADGPNNLVSAPSAAQSFTTTPFALPQLSAPSNISISNFTATWSAVAGATSYSIDVSSTPDFGNLVVNDQPINSGTSTVVSTPGNASPAIQANTTYYYRVHANLGGYSLDNSNTQTVTTLPFAAPQIGAASNITYDSFNANWSPVAGATGYAIDVSVYADFSINVIVNRSVNGGNSTTANVIAPNPWQVPLLPGTIYYYRIRAVGPNNVMSGNSAAQTFTTLTYPAPQVGNATNITINSFTLNWSVLPGASGYAADFSTTPDFSHIVVSNLNLGTGSATSANLSSLGSSSPVLPGTTYYYRVHATVANFSSPNSATQSVTTTAFSGPVVDAPSNITVNSFTANWEPVAGADNYAIDVSSTADFNTFVIHNAYLGAGNPTSGPVSVPYWEPWLPQLTPNTTYYYRIFASAGGTTSTASATNALTTAVLPAPVVGAATNVSIASFTANWNLAPGATKYTIDVSTTPDFGNLVLSQYNLGDGNATSANVTGLATYDLGSNQFTGSVQSGITYYYRIYSQFNGNSSVASATQNVTTLAFLAPQTAAATNVTFYSFTANWNAVDGATGYSLDLSTTPDFGNLVLGNYNLGDGNATSGNVSSDPNSLGGGIIIGGGGGGIILGGPGPGNSSVSSGGVGGGIFFGGGFVFSNGGSNLTFAPVVVGPGSARQPDGTSSGDTPAVSNQTLIQPGTTYYYRIRANVANVVQSANSTTQTLITANFPAPQVSAATNITYTGFTANWSTVPGATGYSIDISSTPDFGNLVASGLNLGDANTTSIDTTQVIVFQTYLETSYLTLQAGTQYYYRIFANGPNGTTSPNPVSQNITTTTFPVPVVGAATQVTCSDFTVNWTPVAGAVGYSLDISTAADFSDPRATTLYFDGGNTSSSGVSAGIIYANGLTLFSNTTYYYRIRADGPNYTSLSSATQCVTTSPFAPPTGTSAAKVTANGFTASWSAIPGATSYVLTVSSTPDFGSVAFCADVGNTTSYTVGNLEPGLTYYFQVNAYSVFGYSGSSSSVSTTTVALSLSTPAYSTWVQGLNLTGANALPQATPFGDNMTNLARYAMNLESSPTEGQRPATSATARAGNNCLTLQYRQRKSLVGYQMIPQSSSDLIHWVDVPATDIEQLADDDANTARFIAYAAIPDQGLVYLRVVVVPTQNN